MVSRSFNLLLYEKNHPQRNTNENSTQKLAILKGNTTIKGLLAFVLVLIGSLLLAAVFAPFSTSTSVSFSVKADLKEVSTYLVGLSEGNHQIAVKETGLKGESITLTEEYANLGVKSTLVHRIELVQQKTKTRVNWKMTTRAIFPLNLYNYVLNIRLTEKLNYESNRVKNRFNQ